MRICFKTLQRYKEILKLQSGDCKILLKRLRFSFGVLPIKYRYMVSSKKKPPERGGFYRLLYPDKGKSRRGCLAQFARTVADDNVIDFRFVAVLLVELLLSRSNKLLVDVVANEVDGATAKATAHNARASYATLLGNVVEEV